MMTSRHQPVSSSRMVTTTKTTIAPTVSEITLQCSDGIRLAGQSWTIQGLTNNNKEEHNNINNNKDPPPPYRILCLHGWMDNCRSFHYLAPSIVQHFISNNNNQQQQRNVELVALDLPGHGHSSHKSLDVSVLIT